MAISFNEVPQTVLTPFTYVEFDNSRANQGASIQPYTILLIGQKTQEGTQEALKALRITSQQQAARAFGAGSELHMMAHGAFENNSVIETVAVALDDPDFAVKAHSKITVSGLATEAGVLELYVAGERVSVPVREGDDAAAVAAAISDTFLRYESLPVLAVATSGVATVTAKNAGAAGNTIDLRLSYYNEAVPVGISVEIPAMAGGAGAPDFTDLWSALGDHHYNILVMPYADSASLGVVTEILSQKSHPEEQKDGIVFVGHYGSYAEASALGGDHNSQFLCIVSTQKSPTLASTYAAAFAAVVANSASIDPARPFQTLALNGVRAPADADRYTRSERNLHLFDGVSSTVVDAGGVVRIERAVTAYKTNAFGGDDPSYRDINTLLALSYLRYDFRTFWGQKYPRHKLANDGTRFAAGQKIVTPKLAKAEALSWFRRHEDNGLVENFEQFKEQLVVERNASNPNRLDFLMPTDLVNQLRVVGVQIQFLV